MAFLYINSRGQEVRRHSYSGGDTFRFCAKKYELQRVRGYREKGQKASMKFGMAIEDAVQCYHNYGLDLSMGLQKFTETWERYKGEPIAYTVTEGSWDEMLLTGQELLQLYHLRLPFFPIVVDKDTPPVFQSQFKKEVFPKTALAGIEFIAYVDMIAELKDTHKAIVIDLKTSGTMLDTTPNIHALDQQLRSYSWITGEPEVAFLVLVKTDRTVGRGSWVSFLQGFDDWQGHRYNAGNMGVVVKTDDEGSAWVVKPDINLDDYKAAGGDRPQTKDGKAGKAAWVTQNAALVPIKILTKQRIQFLPATIDADAQQEAADQIGEDISMIVKASNSNKWKKQGGTRFPNNKCISCCMRGNCLNNPTLRDELVEREDSAEWDVGVEAMFA